MEELVKELTTKADIDLLRQETKTDIASLRKDMIYNQRINYILFGVIIALTSLFNPTTHKLLSSIFPVLK